MFILIYIFVAQLTFTNSIKFKIMPGRDRTGPMGQGSGTGRQLGFCSGSDTPGNNAGNGMGRGLGRRGGRGLGAGNGAGRGLGRRGGSRGQS